MDENAARVLQMLQDGKINAQEAAMLIGALRGEAAQVEVEKKDARKYSFECCGFDGRSLFWLFMLFSLLRSRR